MIDSCDWEEFISNILENALQNMVCKFGYRALECTIAGVQHSIMWQVVLQ